MKNEPADWNDIRNKIVQRYVEVGDCWEWRSFLAKGRTPVVHYTTVDGKHVCTPARKLVAVLWGKRVMDKYKCCTTCENDLCVNPDHIKTVYQNDHLRRASLRAKASGNNTLRSAKIAATKREKVAKLDWEKVAAIRASDKTHGELSQEYGVCKAVVGRIKRNQSWVDYSARSNPFASLMR